MLIKRQFKEIIKEQIDTLEQEPLESNPLEVVLELLENLLSEVDGVKSVNYVTLTQDIDYNSASATETHTFSPGLYTTLIQSDGTTSTTKNKGYGYYYDFSKFYGLGAVAGFGVVLPAYEPAVFELKNPKQNIKGIVR